jgi:hypothetical protein
MKDSSSFNIDSVSLEKNGYCLCKNIFNREKLISLRHYLIGVMGGSLPAYYPIEEGCANFFRLNFDDPRSKVPTKSVQFNFFPWNQDFFAIFDSYGLLFEIRNEANKLIFNCEELSDPSSEGLIHRLAVQYYPAGGGYLSGHSDPIGAHQVYIANIVMSEFGVDYSDGGLFIKENEGGEKVYVEREGGIGDVVLFRADLIHGVDPINVLDEFNPLSGKGRWMLLSALTKPSKSNLLPDAKVYE